MSNSYYFELEARNRVGEWRREADGTRRAREARRAGRRSGRSGDAADVPRVVVVIGGVLRRAVTRG
ncbi:MAG TPA: hypothetical protein VML96_11935 [Egibacteraceae bacterium]|nr:hypothetical protein [Egibacteraceae bacterium]